MFYLFIYLSNYLVIIIIINILFLECRHFCSFAISFSNFRSYHFLVKSTYCNLLVYSYLWLLSGTTFSLRGSGFKTCWGVLILKLRYDCAFRLARGAETRRPFVWLKGRKKKEKNLKRKKKIKKEQKENLQSLTRAKASLHLRLVFYTYFP